MRMINTTNTTQSLNSGVSVHAASRPTLPNHHPLTQDPGNLGYGLGRLLRGTFDHAWNAWQRWWTPEPSPEAITLHRQQLVYRKGLEACVKQLDRALEVLRKNPRDKHNLE